VTSDEMAAAVRDHSDMVARETLAVDVRITSGGGDEPQITVAKVEV
jgi:hypothetical protein